MTPPNHPHGPHGPRGPWPGPYAPHPGGQQFFPRYDQPTVAAGHPFASYGEPEPPRKRGFRRAIIGAAVTLVLLAGGGIAAYVYYNKEIKDAPAGAGEGSCVKVNNASSTDADIQTIDCADPAALFKVGVRQIGQICPGDSYTSYTETTSGRGQATNTFTLCLMLNAKEGECLNGLDSPDKLARVDCAGAEAKVVRLLSGTADENACDEQSTPLVYPKPPTTYCLAEPSP